jgi:hypothetical protein
MRVLLGLCVVIIAAYWIDATYYHGVYFSNVSSMLRQIIGSYK